MGLDMGLYRKGNTDIEIGCWRKANQIHRWFVDNVQLGRDDQNEYDVTQEQLKELRGICQKVLDGSELVTGIVKNGATCSKATGGVFKDNLQVGDVIKDYTIAEELLPTCSGFFFGSTDYDQWYYKQIEKTIAIVDKVLEEAEEDEVFMYWSSW